MTLLSALPALLTVAALSVVPSSGEEAGTARRQILEADTLFARALEDKDLDKFSDFISRDTLFFGAAIKDSREAVMKAWGVYFEPEPRATLAWKPVRAEAASSGDLGYTVGNYVLTTRDEQGHADVKHGVYVTIWRKEKDGAWRAALDIGTPPGAEPLEIPRN